MHGFNQWTVKDRYPDKELEEINPISLRIYSLVARNKTDFEENKNAVEILGALKMIEALDYHYQNYIDCSEDKFLTNRIHETVAYLNRLRQFYYFLISKFLKTTFGIEPEKMTPKILELIKIGMVETAHRALDYKKSHISKERKYTSALTFIGIQVEYDHLHRQKFTLRHNDDPTKWLIFTPEEDHETIMVECYSTFQTMVKKLKNQ
ncbi:hypothetical protein [Flagellimonas aequoris]|uniref:Uncharacterized protein n=1 Tax=Flagellimonas aequoris TaxID=2306997 RepID=A0A418N4E0_9FLAO|nr:hypothetical protein [Allomuricauda aequoris]RIV68705.1 hypothetical protein D2U88_16075 [Allomuricauda aequoris]TXK00404.1 hypothetical protein FQ019_15895 [Allomuricauda aequoris]